MQIRVIQPFAFRASLRDPVKSFDPGRHELTQAEAAHPFLQACIAAGRAELLAPASAAATSSAATSSDGTPGGAAFDGASDGATSGEEGSQAQGAGAGAGAAPPPRKRSARK